MTIYAETGRTNQALTWAREVMRENPDPQAYLAAVHANLGQFKQTYQLLKHEIAANTNTTRTVTLRWQLAEVCDKMADVAAVRKLLDEAAAAAKGTPLEITAQKRVDALKETAR